MKLDQETVAKHQFWFLLGGYFLIWLIAVMWMKFTYPGEIEALRKTYDDAKKGVQTAQGSPVNTATFLPPWEKATKEFTDHKGVIWGEAWKWQAGMYDWPQEWLTKYGMTNPQAPLTPDDRNEYRDKLYPGQIDNLRANAPKWINPVELKDGFDNVFKPMTKKDWKETPTREEIWLAQEDFWVKRELFVVVLDAMTRQALMHPAPIDEKKPTPKGVEARYRFANKNWEITLNIRKNEKGYLVIGGDSTIKNIHPSHHPQPLTSAKGRGIWFIVAQDNLRVPFEVRGEPVSWNETRAFSMEKDQERKDYDQLGGINWNKERLKEHPIAVIQGFDQTNSPIRRINAIELAKQDCRTFIWPLQPNHTLAQLDALPEEEDPSKKAGEAAPAGAPSGGAEGGAGGMMAQSMEMMKKMAPGGAGGGPGGAAESSAVKNPTPNNGLERNRYLQPADQDKKLNPPSRHLPLALQLIVEQSHMYDVQLALANSRLRFQITQVEFHHAKDYTPQSDSDKDKKEGADMAGPRVFMGGMPGMGSMAGNPMQSQMQMQMQKQKQMQGRGTGGGDMAAQMQRQQMQMQKQMQMGSGGPMGSGSGMMMTRPPGMSGMGSGEMKPSFAYAPGRMPPGGFSATPGGNDAKQNASNQQDDNLVELTIYGIATLYRSPDAPQTTEQPGQPGSPAPQPGQQPAAAATPSSSASPPPAAATATPPSGASPPPTTATPPAPKQADDKPVDQQKAPPPPPPPAGNKTPPPAGNKS